MDFFGLLHRLWADESGITTVEYAILLTAVVVVALTAWSAFSSTLGNMVQNGTNEFANAGK